MNPSRGTRKGQLRHLLLCLEVLLGDGSRAGFEGLVRLLHDSEFNDLVRAVDAERVERHRREIRHGEYLIEGVFR